MTEEVPTDEIKHTIPSLAYAVWYDGYYYLFDHKKKLLTHSCQYDKITSWASTNRIAIHQCQSVMKRWYGHIKKVKKD
jgi:signal transduction histidine kinase